jgi:hypothetical protein
MRILVGLFATAVTLSAATACARSPYQAGGEVTPEGAITLHVQNDNFLDVNVYAVSGGMSRRLGTVTGSSAQDFVVNPSLAVRDFRIIATPIGGFGRASSGSLLVSAGETIEFTVGSVLSNSTVSIR